MAYIILERESDYFIFWKNDDTETYANPDGYGIISQNDSGISHFETNELPDFTWFVYSRVYTEYMRE